MELNDLVSIIVPIYNVEKYLETCIESIINQTYKNLEIILVNDGSTDNSLTICKKYEKKDDRIIIIDKQNGGLSDARNAGTLKSKGKYICYIDSDDYVEKDYIKCLYNSIKTNKTDISQCCINYVDDEGNFLKKIGYEKNQVFDSKQLIIDTMEKNKLENTVVWNKMYLSSIMKKHLFPKGKIHEDEYITYKVIYESKKVSMVSECLYNYRQQENSITNKKYSLKRLDPKEAFKEKIEYFSEKGEEKIKYLSVNQYLSFLKINHYQVLKELNDKVNANMLYLEYKDIYMKYKNNKYISIKEKIKNMFFYISPKLYNDVFYNIKSKIKHKINYQKKLIIKNEQMKKSFLLNCSDCNEKKVFIFGTPIHGNIGDHAILVAEKKLITDNFPKCKVIEVESEFFLRNKKLVKKLVKDSPIFLTGGGFLGSLWLNEETVFRTMIKTFKKNNIIVFPQTIYFSDDKIGKKELKKSQKIYKKSKSLIFYCREKYSYDFMKKHFSTVVCKLAPDMVLYLNKNKLEKNKENKILLCMRKDKEKVQDSEKINSYLQNKGELCYTDTVINQNIYELDRDKILKSKIDEFSKYKLVVTDRLHGMIFAYLACTPCIVFENKSYKIKGVYEWIKDCDYITIANAEELSKLKYSEDAPNYEFDKNHYQKLVEDIKRII